MKAEKLTRPPSTGGYQTRHLLEKDAINYSAASRQTCPRQIHTYVQCRFVLGAFWQSLEETCVSIFLWQTSQLNYCVHGCAPEACHCCCDALSCACLDPISHTSSPL